MDGNQGTTRKEGRKAIVLNAIFFNGDEKFCIQEKVKSRSNTSFKLLATVYEIHVFVSGRRLATILGIRMVSRFWAFFFIYVVPMVFFESLFPCSFSPTGPSLGVQPSHLNPPENALSIELPA